MAPNPTRWGKNFASQILNLLGFIDGAFFVSGSRLFVSGICFKWKFTPIVIATKLCDSTKEMAGNPSTLFFRLPQTTPGKRYPPLQRSSGKLSPSESASFRIFSTSLLLQMDFKLSPPKIIGKTRSKKGLRIFPCYHPAGKNPATTSSGRVLPPTPSPWFSSFSKEGYGLVAYTPGCQLPRLWSVHWRVLKERSR